jgi:hypothetical protein
MQTTTVETSIKALFGICVVGCPCLVVTAYRGWANDRSQNLLQRRTLLGLASVSLTLFNWLAFIVTIMAGRTSMRVGVALSLDIWAPISVLIALASTALAFALAGMARIYAVSAALLMAAIWVIGFLGGRN